MNSNYEKRSQEAECSSQHNTEDIPPDLQKELCRHYRDVESTLTFSPLVEENDESLFKLYVRLPLQALDSPHNYSQFKKTGRKRKHSEDVYGEDNENPVFIESYKMLFQTSEHVFPKNIYVTADAGMGKTSLTKHLAMTWCQAHFPDESLCEHFIKDDLDALKQFDLCFLLHLRDFQGCDLDEMILEFLSRYISGLYSKTSLEKILHEKNCLIILDGLDEWCHPAACSRRDKSIPHRKTRQCCTFLTTTRKWKLSTSGLTSKQIDRHVEICGLDASSSRSLDNNAVQLLNKRPGAAQKDVADFESKVSHARLGELRFVPYIKLQLLSMWFDGREIGNSKCDIYSNIIDFTLERGLTLKDISPPEVSNPHTDFVLPKCMADCERCYDHINLIYKLGKLAFVSLCHKELESTLIFDRITVLEYLDSREIDFLLTIGLLSQSKDPRLVSKVRQTISFQHKSLQEFFAAVYITGGWLKEINGIETAMMEALKALDDVLEMSDMFIFLSGMSTEVFSEIAWILEYVVENDKNIIAYRKDPYSTDETLGGHVWSYQSMQLDCFVESKCRCLVPLHDIIVGRGVSFHERTFLKAILELSFENESINENESEHEIENESENKRNNESENEHEFFSSEVQVKSINIHDDNADFLKDIDTAVYQSMEALLVWNCFEPEVFGPVLIGSANALKNLSVHVALECGSFPGIDDLNSLQDLYLENVRLHHAELEKLFEVLKAKSKLISLNLDNVACLDKHSHNCRNINLDLSQLKEIQQLKLSDIQVCELHLNTEALEKFNIDFIQLLPPNNIQQVCDSIANAQMLKELKICGMSGHDGSVTLDISRLNKLQTLNISHIPHIPNKTVELCTTIIYSRVDNVSYSSPSLDKVASTTPRLQERKESGETGYFVLSVSSEMADLQCMDITCVTLNSSAWIQLFQHVRTLKQLETIILRNVNIGDSVILLSPEMTSLCSLKLDTVIMTTAAWTELAQTIATLKNLKFLELTSIILSDGGNFVLLFTPELTSLLSVKLNRITMDTSAWRNLFHSINEIHQLESLELEHVDFGDTFFLSTIMTNLKSVNLTHMTMTACALRELLCCTASLSNTFSMNLKEIVITMSERKPVLIHLFCQPKYINIKLLNKIMDKMEWTKFLSTFLNLPHSIRLTLFFTEMPAKEWRELFFDILSSLSQPVDVELHFCSGPTLDEWNSIVNELKSSSTKYIVFETRVPRRQNLNVFETLLITNTGNG